MERALIIIIVQAIALVICGYYIYRLRQKAYPDGKRFVRLEFDRKAQEQLMTMGFILQTTGAASTVAKCIEIAFMWLMRDTEKDDDGRIYPET